MPTFTPTKEQGATAKASEVVYVHPDQQVSEDQLGRAFTEAGFNGPFLADLMSAFLAHERCGVHLYRSVAGRTNNPLLKQKYEEFRAETERHVEILEQIIEGMGDNPHYVSPAARATEKAGTGLVESTFMLGGSVDVMTQEMVMLEAVLLAETKDHANWQFLSQLVPELPEGELRRVLAEAVTTVEAQEDEHLGWAQDTRSRMAMLQAKSSLGAKAGAKAEELVATVRDWLR
jgi:rubrerythrin